MITFKTLNSQVLNSALFIAMAALLTIAAGLAVLSAPQKADAAVFTIASSTRFISGTPSYLRKTLATPTDNKKWTYSLWVKRGKLDYESAMILDAYTNSSNYGYLGFRYAATPGYNTLEWYDPSGGYLTSTPVYRDPSKWYHVVVAYDTTQSTAANRIKFYVDGTQVTAFNRSSYPSLNYASGMINSAVSHDVGLWQYDNSAFDGYMSDVYFVDGQALDPTYFGATDSNGYWRPKTYTGTYGTNGFHLPLTTTSPGDDTSSNNSDWTASGLASTDNVKDSPTNSFATLSPIDKKQSGPTLTSGNLAYSGSGYVASTFGVSSGKWYFETVPTGTFSSSGVSVGVVAGNYWSLESVPGGTATGLWTVYDNGSGINGFNLMNEGSNSATPSKLTSGSTVQIALDADNGKIWIGQNNTWYDSSAGTTGNPTTGVNPTFTVASPSSRAPFKIVIGNNTASVTYVSTFGQGGQSGLTYSSSAGGYFKYTPPTGYKALSTVNLPNVAIQKPKLYFDAITYTGTGASQSISSAAFTPSLVWIKNRTDASTSHAIFDAVRGVQKFLPSNSTGVEDTDDTQSLSAFTSTGFSLGTGASTANVNTSAKSYISWLWKESSTSGFDIVTYTGTGAAHTVAHSLGGTPKLMIFKQRSSSGQSPIVWSSLLSGNDYYLVLSSTAAQSNSGGAAVWNTTAPTASVFTVGTDATTNQNGETYVAYLFAEVDGFSKFGTYTGNGSADGPFIYTGFKPRFVLVKKTSAADGWVMHDSARSTYNVANLTLRGEDAGAESTTVAQIDILSNGFKVRNTNGEMNTSSGTYIYAAFAEQPFKLSAAPAFGEVTTTARKIRLWGGIRLLGGIRLW